MRRYPKEEWLPHATAFQQACLAEGFQDDPDQNHPESTGVSPRARNTLDGVRISTALAYLNTARHRLNLTIKADVTARQIIFEGRRATGVEVESGGERFTVEGDEIVLSSGAIGSPHLLLLSGVGPAEQLRSMGLKVVHDLAGVGKNLRDHPNATVLFRAKGERLDVQAPVIQVGLRYTVEGSYLRNDMQVSPTLLTSEHRPAQVEVVDEVLDLARVVRSGDDPIHAVLQAFVQLQPARHIVAHLRLRNWRNGETQLEDLFEVILRP